MISLVINGERRWVDPQYFGEQIADLETRSRSGPLSREEQNELEAYTSYLHHSGQLRTRAANPSATERVDNAVAGYGQPVPGATMRATERGGWITASGDSNLNADRTRGMNTIEQYSRSGVLSSTAADRLDTLLRTGDPDAVTARYIDAVGDLDYATAFGKIVVDPQTGHLRHTPAEVEAMRAVTAAQRAALTTATSGFALPLTVDSTIIQTGSGALNPLRELATVITIGTHDWVGVSSDGVTASYVAEGVEATDASPSLAAPRIATAQGRAFCQFTIEASQDWPSLQNQLVSLVSDARDVLDATMWLTGNGTAQPSGIFGGVTNSLGTAQRVLTTGTAAYAVGDPWLLKQAIPPRFSGNTTFVANPATFDSTYRFVGGNSTEPVQFDTGRGGSFLGRPKAELSTMATGATSGTKLMLGGDFAASLRVIERIGMTAELLPHMLGTNRLPTGTRGLYTYWRASSGVVAQAALRYLEVR